MASEIDALMDRIKAIKAEAEEIEKEAAAADRELFDEETDKINALMDEADEAQEKIRAIERDEARARVSKAAQFLDELEPRKTASVRVVGDNRSKDPKCGFSGLGSFAMAVHEGSKVGGTVDERLRLMAATGMGQMVGSDGGFLVPPAFSQTIWDGLRSEANNLLGMTDNYTVDGESLTFPANAETSRATGSRYGGVQGYWISEASQITSSKPTVRQIKLEPQELAVLVYATDKLLRNGTAVEQYLTRAAIEEINFMVGDSIINGTGAGQPLGVLNANCTVSVSKETGQTAATVVTENVTKMFSRLHARSQQSAVWLINQDIWPQLLTMQVAVGTGGAAVFLPPGQTIANAPYGTLYGRPIIPIEYAATLGTVGDIILADLTGYATGTQGGIDTGMSIHLKFDYGETAFRFRFAVDGQPWLQSALTPFKGSNTQSTFITLATRA